MKSDQPPKAWYRHPIMWLVIAPPVGSVIAGIITFVLILKHPDPVIKTAPPTVAVLRGGTANSVVPPAE
ncbi:MAG TPA: hypothetical protein VKP66_22315 [Steroidobacteraceae bacterium]|nr:hypothetical protein [Steroidobacteraceae bacterium]